MADGFRTFPDAEVAVIDYLREYLPSYDVDVKPEQFYRPENDGIYVRLNRVGGQPVYPVKDEPMLDIDVWAPNRWTGLEALQAVLAHLEVATRRPKVYASMGKLTVVTGPQHIEDPQTKEPHWQALVQIVIR